MPANVGQPSLAYSLEAVIRHLRIHHPGCPKEISRAIAERVSAKEWSGATIGAAVGIELQNFIRHTLTDYDELIRSRTMTREEARAFIAKDVRKVLRIWRKPAVKLRAVHPKGYV
jgi:hypothetical protein